MPLWLNERSYIPAPPSNATTIDMTEILGDASNSIENLATVPLVSFVASFIASMIFKQTDRKIGHKIGYLIGSVVSFLGKLFVLLAKLLISRTFLL